MHWCNHCFTITATEDAERVQMREENQRPLTQMAYLGTVNGTDSGENTARSVELTDPGDTEKEFNWLDIWARPTTTASVLSGCKRGYDCTMKAVSAVENKPAYRKRSVVNRSTTEDRYKQI